MLYKVLVKITPALPYTWLVKHHQLIRATAGMYLAHFFLCVKFYHVNIVPVIWQRETQSKHLNNGLCYSDCFLMHGDEPSQPVPRYL